MRPPDSGFRRSDRLLHFKCDCPDRLITRVDARRGVGQNNAAMKLHEYQAKEIFAHHGIPVPNGKLARTPGEAAEAATLFGGAPQ